MKQATDPLSRRVVWLTREAPANEAWRAVFEAAGAFVYSLPCVALHPRGLDALPGCLAGADWLLLTSPTAVRLLGTHVHADRLPEGVKVAVVGPGTRAAVEALGWPVTLEAARPDASGLVAELTRLSPLASTRVLWPRSSQASAEPVEALRAAGAHVEAPAFYDNVAPPDLAAHVAAARAAAAPDWIVLASGSAFRHLLGAWPTLALASGVRLAAIGGPTARAIVEAGSIAAAVASAPTAEAVLASIREVERS